MSDVKYKLKYAGVDWKKVYNKQQAKFDAKAGDVVILQQADPEKLQIAKELQKAARKERKAKQRAWKEANGLILPKKKKAKK
jgi:hypothetical protein